MVQARDGLHEVFGYLTPPQRAGTGNLRFSYLGCETVISSLTTGAQKLNMPTVTLVALISPS